MPRVTPDNLTAALTAAIAAGSVPNAGTPTIAISDTAPQLAITLPTGALGAAEGAADTGNVGEALRLALELIYQGLVFLPAVQSPDTWIVRKYDPVRVDNNTEQVTYQLTFNVAVSGGNDFTGKNVK